jgi:hypothetical protein
VQHRRVIVCGTRIFKVSGKERSCINVQMSGWHHFIYMMDDAIRKAEDQGGNPARQPKPIINTCRRIQRQKRPGPGQPSW